MSRVPKPIYTSSESPLALLGRLHRLFSGFAYADNSQQHLAVVPTTYAPIRDPSSSKSKRCDGTIQISQFLRWLNCQLSYYWHRLAINNDGQSDQSPPHIFTNGYEPMVSGKKWHVFFLLGICERFYECVSFFLFFHGQRERKKSICSDFDQWARIFSCLLLFGTHCFSMETMCATRERDNAKQGIIASLDWSS